MNNIIVENKNVITHVKWCTLEPSIKLYDIVKIVNIGKSVILNVYLDTSKNHR